VEETLPIIVQDLSETFPDVIVCKDLSEALDLVTRFDRCQIIDPNTGIVRVYDRNSELRVQSVMMDYEDF
jgi:hypothetical protein